MLLNLNKLKENLFNVSLALVVLNGAKTFILPEFYVRGVFIDFISPVVYINYLIIFFIVIFFIKEIRKFDWYLITSIISLLIFNLTFSLFPLITFTYLAKSFLYLPFLFILIRVRPQVNYRFVFLLNVFYIAVFTLQFVLKASFFPYLPFGFYYFDGLGANMDFVNLFGTKVVAPPTNFPHPNVFAAFLSFVNIYNIKKSRILFLTNLVVILLIGSFAGLLFNAILFIKSNRYLNSKYTTLFLFVVFVSVFIYYFLFQYKDISLIQRIDQLEMSLFFIRQFPISGVGLANFVPAITLFEQAQKRVYTLQPAHNIFLLYIVEFGAIGVVYLIFFLKRYRRYIRITTFALFILVFGSFDHFLFTLNQGILLAALTIFAHVSIINTND